MQEGNRVAPPSEWRLNEPSTSYSIPHACSRIRLRFGCDRSGASSRTGGGSARHDCSPISKPTRAIVVVRTRIAEDTLAASGATQYVLLGAGLDTFAYRNPFADVRIFEVDHPATQALKCGRLTTAGISLPASLSYVACDFARDCLPVALTAAGFDSSRPTVFAWLGVVMYLERSEITTPCATSQPCHRGQR